MEQQWHSEGLTCTLRLPLDRRRQARQSAPAFRQPAPNRAATSPLAGLRVLVFETDALNAMALSRLFENLGCTLVGPVTTQREALNLARSEPVDVAVVDAGFDGTLCRPITDALTEQGVPNVICTCWDSYPQPDTILLAKPFDFENLRAAIAKALHRSTG